MNYFDLSLPENQIQNYSTIREFIEDCCIQYSDRTVLIDKGQQYTYNDLYKYIHKIIAFMNIHQFKENDLIGIIACDGIDYIATSLAVMAYGCTMVALPSNLPQEALLGCAYKYKLKGILYDVSQQTKIDFVQNNQFNGIMVCIPYIINNYTATFKYIIQNNDCTSEQIAAIMFTTGTEGIPKGAMLTHKNLLTGARNGLLGFGPFGYNEDNQIYQLTIPLTHTFGFVRNLLCCLQTGSKLVISIDNISIFADMQKYQVTRLITVPGLCEVILKMAKQYGKAFIGTQLDYIVIGGADFSSRLIKDMASLGICVYGGYGMTETANLFTGNPEPNEYPDSIGYLYPNEEIKIIDDELWVKGDNVFVGYYGEDNTQIFDQDGFFATGDLVRIDHNTGFLYFIGRKKDIIVLSSGVNIAPTAIEEYLINNLRFIEECIVYSLNNNQLICEIYAPHKPNDDDISSLYSVNEIMPTEWKIHQFIFRNQPFEKDKKMSIVRRRNK